MKQRVGGWISGAAVLALVSGGCNATTAFPAGLEPWEMTNNATPPAATATAMYPETLSFWEGRFTLPNNSRINSVHARAWLQVPIAQAFAAARDPQTGRDPTASQGFRVLQYNTESTYQFSYRTSVHVDFPVLDWQVAWRHGIVMGSLEAPQVTATRWQKVDGTSLLTTLEGSLVLRAVAGQPNVTEVLYQYHLAAPTSTTTTITDYLTVIFGRLRDRAHNVQLTPSDCTDCATPPAGY